MGDSNYFIGNSLNNSNVNVGSGNQIINDDKIDELVQSTKKLIEEINSAKDELGDNYQELINDVENIQKNLSQPNPDKGYIYHF